MRSLLVVVQISERVLWEIGLYATTVMTIVSYRGDADENCKSIRVQG